MNALMNAPTETALIVPVPEVEPIVGRFRDRYDPAAADGIPAHVTVVYPFLPSETISFDVVRTLSELFAGVPQFHAEFSETRWFPGVLYFAPMEDLPFRRLTERVVEKYPQAPPYGGQFREIVPHLTIAHADDQVELDEIAVQFALAANGRIPVRAVVRAVELIEKGNGTWCTKARFPLKAETTPA